MNERHRHGFALYVDDIITASRSFSSEYMQPGSDLSAVHHVTQQFFQTSHVTRLTPHTGAGGDGSVCMSTTVHVCVRLSLTLENEFAVSGAAAGGEAVGTRVHGTRGSPDPRFAIL